VGAELLSHKNGGKHRADPAKEKKIHNERRLAPVAEKVLCQDGDGYKPSQKHCKAERHETG